MATSRRRLNISGHSNRNNRNILATVCVLYVTLWFFFGLFSENPEPKVQHAIGERLGILTKPIQAPVENYDYQTVFHKPDVKGPKRYAYLLMHYEGTVLDDEYLLGNRVLIKSLQLSRTKHDIVVMTTNARASSIQKFVDDGVYVVQVPPIANPYRDNAERRTTYKAHFELTLNKLYAWKMIRYERVVYMDADNLVIDNMDDIVKCGHFCAEFMNQVNFHTGVLVVKPDVAKFDDLVKKLDELPSYDGADQGFLTAYFSRLQYAPLFDPSQPQSEEKENRLAYGYNLNHIYYYEKMSFRLHTGPGNPYSGNRGHYYAVPGKSIGYCIMQLAKPWNFYPYFYFNLHWEWQYVRGFVREDYTWSVVYVTRLLGIAIGYAASLHVFDYLRDANPGQKIAGVRDRASRFLVATILRFGRYGALLVGFVYGVFAVVISSPVFLSSTTVLPVTMPPNWGLFLMHTIHTLGLYWALSVLAVLTHNNIPSIHEFRWEWAAKMLFFWLGQQGGWLFDQFLNKIWGVIGFGACIVIYDITLFITMAYTVSYRHGLKVPYAGTIRCVDHQTPRVADV